MSADVTYYRTRGFTRWFNWVFLLAGLVGIASVTYLWVMSLVMLINDPGPIQKSISSIPLRNHLDHIGMIVILYFAWGLAPLHNFKLLNSTRLGLSEEGIEFISFGLTLKAPWESIYLKHEFLGQYILVVESPKVTKFEWSLPVLFKRFFLRMRGREKINLNPFTTRWQDSELRQDIEYYLQARASEPESELVTGA